MRAPNLLLVIWYWYVSRAVAEGCDWCEETGHRLTPFTNGFSYCPRCAKNMIALGYAKPVEGETK